MASQPASVTAANDYRQELLSRDQAAAADMARYWSQVEANLQTEIEALAAEMAAAREDGTEITIAALYNWDRYQLLLGQVTAELSRFNAIAAGQITDLQGAAVDLAQVSAADLIHATASDVGAIGMTFDRLPTEATENIAALARAGQPLGDLLQANYPLAAQGIADQLVQGVARGVNPREVARDVVRQGLSQAYKHTVLVARDQHLRAYRTATAQAYQNSGVVNQYRRLAAKNDRTCLACLALDGEYFDLADLMPLHPQDRCTMLPVIGGFGPIFAPVQYETGAEWFAKQSEDYQRKALGPGRFQMWERGQFSFKQLVTVKPNDTWGPSAAVTTLRDLKRGLGGLPGRGRLPLPPEPGKPPPNDPPASAVQVPRFKNRAAAHTWARKNYPDIVHDYSKMNLEAIQETLDAFQEMAVKYPHVIEGMTYMGSYGRADLRPWFRKRRRWGGEIAHVYQSHGVMGFNPKYYNDLARMRASSAHSQATGWTFNPPGQEYASTLYHEFGHMVESYYQRFPLEEGVLRDRGGPAAILNTWARRVIDRDPGLTRYGRTEPAEAIAEAFSNLQLFAPEDRIKSAHELEALLTIFSEEYARDFDPPGYDTEEEYDLWADREVARDEELDKLLDSILDGTYTPGS